MAISAFWRRKVDLPAMLGPVTSQMRAARLVEAGSGRRAAEIAVVGDEGAALRARKRLLDHRMAAAAIVEARASRRRSGRT